MEIHPPMIQQPFADSSSFSPSMPRPVKTLDGFEAHNDHSSVPFLSDRKGSSVSFPSEAHEGQNLAPSASLSGADMEACDSELSPEETWMPPEDTCTTSTNPFSATGMVPSMVGAGLANLGNTCFMNSILQCFTHTVPLIHGLRSCSHSAPCDGGSDRFCVLCALRDHIELSLATSGGILSPIKLVDNLDYFSSSFRRYQQEDAHEFMQCFLDKLERCFLDSGTKNKSSEQHENLVKQIFGGRLVSKLRCCNCGHSSDTYEPLIDLSLEIENVDNLLCALESFTMVEKIDEKFRCDSCKEEVLMEKQLMLDQAPSVAAFHLKRFKTDGTYVEKIDKHVDFPLELDLQPYSSCNENDNVALKYDLYAIVEHVGFSSTSGHYFCFIRSSPDTWHRLDDSKVSRVLGEFVLTQEAYILFYARKGTPWLESIMKAQKQCLDPSIISTPHKSVLDNVGMYDSHLSVDAVSCDASESKEFVEGVPTYSCGGKNEGLVVNGIIDSSHSPQPFTSRITQVGAGSIKFSADNTVIQIQASPKKNGTLPSLERDGHQDIVDDKEKVLFHPLTPPSSPGPDPYSPDTSFHIPRNHLKTEKHSSNKKRLNKSPEDTHRKEAIRYLRSVPGARGKKLMDALLEPQSDSALNKRRKRMDSPRCKKASPPSGHQKSKHGSVMRPLAA